MRPKPVYTEHLCPHCRGIGCPHCNRTGQQIDHEETERQYDEYWQRKLDEKRGK